MPGHVALYFTLLLTSYPYQSKDNSVTRQSKKKVIIAHAPASDSSICGGHAFNSTTLCWLPFRLPRNSTNMFQRNENGKPPKLSLFGSELLSTLSILSISRQLSFPQITLYGNKNIKAKKNKENPPPVNLPIYRRNCFKYCLTILETNMKRKTPNFSKKKEKKTFPNAKSMVLRKREIFHH